MRTGKIVLFVAVCLALGFDRAAALPNPPNQPQRTNIENAIGLVEQMADELVRNVEKQGPGAPPDQIRAAHEDRQFWRQLAVNLRRLLNNGKIVVDPALEQRGERAVTEDATITLRPSVAGGWTGWPPSRATSST
ncbi:MAG: hypothetical protein Q8N47_20845 [Bryobacterales bacterium]|nr:hypothetical protein [Bryobacterales bacterium]